MSTTKVEGLINLIADALSLTRPRMMAAPLDSLFQHKQDAEAIADVIGIECPDFDRVAFLERVGWKREQPMDIQGTSHDDDNNSSAAPTQGSS